MNSSILIIAGLISFIFAYRFYARKLYKILGVDNSKPTPAHTLKDGVDYCPARMPVLLGHHFSSIAGAAPMIGFLGTVTGMILAFYKMASEQNVTPDVLAGGIYQALITTAFGLTIGIAAFIGYNILVSRVGKVVYNMEQTTVEFMDLLQEPVQTPGA